MVNKKIYKSDWRFKKRQPYEEKQGGIKQSKSFKSHFGRRKNKKMNWFRFKLYTIQSKQLFFRSLRLFYKRFIHKGLYLTGFRTMAQLCRLIKRHYRRKPFAILYRFLRSIPPAVQLRAIRKSGKTHLVPVLFRSRARPVIISLNWFFKSVQERSVKRTPLLKRLAVQSFNELKDVLAFRGSTVSKRREWHRIALRNRAIRHFAKRRSKKKNRVRPITRDLKHRRAVGIGQAYRFFFPSLWFNLYTRRLWFLRACLRVDFRNLKSFIFFGRTRFRYLLVLRHRLVYSSYHYAIFLFFKRQMLKNNGLWNFCTRVNFFIRYSFFFILYLFNVLRRKNIGISFRMWRKFDSLRHMRKEISTGLLRNFRRLLFRKSLVNSEPIGLCADYRGQRNKILSNYLFQHITRTNSLSGYLLQREIMKRRGFVRKFTQFLLNRFKRARLRVAGHIPNLFNLSRSQSRAGLPEYSMVLGSKDWGYPTFDKIITLNQGGVDHNFSKRAATLEKCIWSSDRAGRPIRVNSIFNVYVPNYQYFFDFIRYRMFKNLVKSKKYLKLYNIKSIFNYVRKRYIKFIDERALPRSKTRIKQFQKIKKLLFKTLRAPARPLSKFTYVNFWLPCYYLYFKRFSEYFRLVRGLLEPKLKFVTLNLIDKQQNKRIQLRSFKNFHSSQGTRGVNELLEYVPDWRLRTKSTKASFKLYLALAPILTRYRYLDFWDKKIALLRYFSVRKLKSGIFFAARLAFSLMVRLLKRMLWSEQINKIFLNRQQFNQDIYCRDDLVTYSAKLPFSMATLRNFWGLENRASARFIIGHGPRFYWVRGMFKKILFKKKNKKILFKKKNKNP